MSAVTVRESSVCASTSLSVPAPVYCTGKEPYIVHIEMIERHGESEDRFR